MYTGIFTRTLNIVVQWLNSKSQIMSKHKLDIQIISVIQKEASYKMYLMISIYLVIKMFK